MSSAKSQLTKDRYIRASNFQAKSQMLSVLSARNQEEVVVEDAVYRIDLERQKFARGKWI